MKNIKLWTVTWILIQNWAYWQRLQQTDCRLSCWPLWGTLTRLGKQSRYLYSATCVPAWTSSQTALPILSWAFWCCSQGPWASLRSPWLLECEYSPALWIPFFFFFLILWRYLICVWYRTAWDIQAFFSCSVHLLSSQLLRCSLHILSSSSWKTMSYLWLQGYQVPRVM